MLFYSSNDIVKEVFTTTLRLRLLKNSIVHYTFLPDAELNLEQAILNHDVYQNFKTGVHPLLIDSMGGFINPTKEYSDYIKSKERVTPLIGRAIVTNSLAHKFFLSVYYKATETMYPIKIFKSYEPAEKWLLALSSTKKINILG